MLLSEGLRLKVLNVSSLPAWASLCMDFLFSVILMARNHIDLKPEPSCLLIGSGKIKNLTCKSHLYEFYASLIHAP